MHRVSQERERDARAMQVIAREFTVRADARSVPGMLWSEEGPPRRRPLVLIGHGGSQHKTHPGVVELAERFVRDHGFVVAAISNSKPWSKIEFVQAAGRSRETVLI